MLFRNGKKHIKQMPEFVAGDLTTMMKRMVFRRYLDFSVLLIREER
jgi:hypothetical protein